MSVADRRCEQKLYSKVEMCCMLESALDFEGESAVGCLYEDEIEKQEHRRKAFIENSHFGIYEFRSELMLSE
jgi:hypothetical protein